MVLGILSDSHGKAARTGTAVRLLRERGADLLIHLGDVETTAVLDELLPLPARIVFGNCDDIEPLARHARAHGIMVDHPVGTIKVREMRVMYTHGHLERVIAAALAEQPTHLLHGHTHELRDAMVGPTRVLNPGALHRADRYTAMLLHCLTGRVEVVEIGRE